MPEPAQAPGSRRAAILCGLLFTIAAAFCLRTLEWPAWQNPEYRFDNEMLLATHDAYHWLAGACGFGAAVDHPMAVLLKYMADLAHVPPAAAAFWFPAILASLVGGIVYLWAIALGARGAAIAAGLIATISPGFLGRTLLGFYDTDLVTLFFPLVIAFAPAVWCCRFPGPLAALPGLLSHRGDAPVIAEPEHDCPDSRFWIAIFAVSGVLAFWTQEWHSVFPYLARFNALFLFFAILCLGRRRALLLTLALCYALPCAAGLPGLVFPAIYLLFYKWRRHFYSRWLVAVLWICVFALLAQGAILDTLLNQINAYLKHSGDAHSSGSSSLVFPSVAQSIIEVQDLEFAALFPYFHPWLEAGILGFLGFFWIILRRPGAMFLLPLAALAILGSRLGGRMVMFGAPIVALGIALPAQWFLRRLLARRLGASATSWLVCLLLCAILIAPFLDMIPALSQGPVLNRRHAAALSAAGAITPPDATLWLWWDWGYAAHYFARRQTIADGARHGGPSLYLPAAVFATDNARFARQIIRYASARRNEPGEFFRDCDASQAQALLGELASAQTPLVKGEGRQYLIVSFEMLKLGFWISNFGNWNFEKREGEGGALSIVPQAVSYRLNAGEVRLADSESVIFPASINIFAETGITRRDYVREWFLEHPKATVAEREAWLKSRRNINFLFNLVTDEKLAVDQGIYNSLMAQLLLCEANDPRFSPYFRLVYDNVFARIYEVLP